MRRILLGVLTTLVSVNLWTGGPLLALWVGSRVQSAVGQPTMGAVAVTLAVLIVVTYVLYKALAYLTASYNEAIGRVAPRRHQAWLKPMSGERRSIEVRRPLNASERIVIVTVVIAVLLFEVWFFLFAHLALPS
jgi:predicted secreted protein